jgi:hypothetical protein
MSHYLAAHCPQCSKWVPVRQCEGDDPTFDPGLNVQIVCPHCGGRFQIQAHLLEVVPESKLQSS